MLGTERRQKIEETAARIRKLLSEIEETTAEMAELVDQDAQIEAAAEGAL